MKESVRIFANTVERLLVDEWTRGGNIVYRASRRQLGDTVRLIARTRDGVALEINISEHVDG
jgi:hypothetical protein